MFFIISLWTSVLRTFTSLLKFAVVMLILYTSLLKFSISTFFGDFLITLF